MSDVLHDPFYSQRPQRIYRFTDAVGGPDDLIERADPDRLLTETLRSSRLQIDAAADTWGREGVHPYLVHEALRLHREPGSQIEGKTLLVLNGAPRTGSSGTESNGHDFFLGRLENNLAAIGPLAVFAGVRDQLAQGIFRIPEGKYWPKGCQYRSSFVARAGWDSSHLQEAETENIPRLQGTTVGLVDRYGSLKLLARDPDRWIEELATEAITSSNSETQGLKIVGVQIGDIRHDIALALEEGSTLTNVTRQGSNTLVLYRDHTRGHRPTIVWPWQKGATKSEKIANSPYVQFGRRSDIEGMPIAIR